MSAVRSYGPLELVRNSPGLSDYLNAVELRLDRLLERGGGVIGKAASQTLHAGGKRLRPVLVFLSSPIDRPAPVAAGVAVELVHFASLVHDDLIDGATLRRGVPSMWSAFGKSVATASGDCLFALAFSELAREGDPGALEALAEAALALTEGEALQREQLFDPSVGIDAQLDRCARKTGALFSVACRLGAGDVSSQLGDFGLALGIAFQIVDDILDCVDETGKTGKTPGTDLRDGVPTIPLLLAAEQDELVRSALAGGSCAGVLKRVAASGALERSQEIAREYARAACTYLDGHGRARALEALAQVVVERTR
ncbi:MAG: polyprenyl synthetase family protein [Gaiellaceae bacterium]|jgi:octaprenyl-diphosphate synthase